MSDDENGNQPPPESPPPDASAEEKKFSQADVDRVVQERLDRDRRSRGGQQKPKADSPQAAQPTDDRITLKQLHADLQSERIEREFDRIALREKLSEQQADALRPLYKVWRPSAGEADGAEWLRGIRGAFGGGAPAPNQPKPTPAPPNAIPASDAGAPAAPVAFTEDTPLWQLKPQDRDHLRRTKGDAWYNATLRAQLKGTRVVLKKP
ncbi:MAG TPA: hypothetical protein VMY88_01550 [Acidimicrobiales bacterium]|nr:hypothetical protein [Acidimicrobiales bacterium]